MAIKRVAVIGLGPSGAITIDALAQEQAFDQIRVFERREAPGGCWIEDTSPPPNIDPTDLAALASRQADRPIPPPSTLPAKTPRLTLPRYSESSVYPYLETNVHNVAMSFTQEPIEGDPSPLSISKHGPQTPFRHHTIINKFINSLVHRNGYEKLVSYNTTVELAEKVGDEWRLVLRKPSAVRGEEEKDEWWEERFDAVVVASGHFSVPYIPQIPGLEEFERARPGSVQHTKMFRGRDAYKGKKVVVVGASVSAADISCDLINMSQHPIYAVVLGHKPNGFFGDIAFQHPSIVQKPSISHISISSTKQCTVHFIDGTCVANVDNLIFGTGYTWTLPFLPHVEIRNNRVPGLYQHVVYTKDPTLLFVGAVAPGLTFRIFEWQAVLAARVLSGRARLPPLAQQQDWERERIKKKGDGVPFTLVFPDFEEYFNGVRELAGVPGEGVPGRRLPLFESRWMEVLMGGHEMRKRWWKEQNEKARGVLEEPVRARL
ncbi:hypothetical protein J1614_008094 [Plenodomus biglobosus]|nr:hypothetical protein J1614_008094 [Plenodomus biglobosus]